LKRNKKILYATRFIKVPFLLNLLPTNGKNIFGSGLPRKLLLNV